MLLRLLLLWGSSLAACAYLPGVVRSLVPRGVMVARSHDSQQRSSTGALSASRGSDGEEVSSNPNNAYDLWISDGVARNVQELTEDHVEACLTLLQDSAYGQQMFGHSANAAAAIGITGRIRLAEVEGPTVRVNLEGGFWHKRATVLGKAALWLHACMPEIMHVEVAALEDLEDFEDYRDDDTGELLYVHDKRSPDYNGDRGTMEYQGIDPDVRGPFPSGTQGFKINPA
jgi:hypothetical protein